MATIFSREEKAEALFGEILKNPEACRRLMDTFNDSLDMADVLDAPTVKWDRLVLWLMLSGTCRYQSCSWRRLLC